MASALERRMLPKGAAAASESETPVRREDQDRINAFSRLTNRQAALDLKLEALQRQKSEIDDAALELELADDDERVPFKVGDAFVSLAAEKVLTLLNEQETSLSAQIATLQQQHGAAGEEMTGLKAQLYARFGTSINLER